MTHPTVELELSEDLTRLLEAVGAAVGRGFARGQQEATPAPAPKVADLPPPAPAPRPPASGPPAPPPLPPAPPDRPLPAPLHSFTATRPRSTVPESRAAIEAQILSDLASAGGPLQLRNLAQAHGLLPTNWQLRRALVALVDAGKIRKTGRTNGTLYHLVGEGRPPPAPASTPKLPPARPASPSHAQRSHASALEAASERSASPGRKPSRLLAGAPPAARWTQEDLDPNSRKVLEVMRELGEEDVTLEDFAARMWPRQLPDQVKGSARSMLERHAYSGLVTVRRIGQGLRVSLTIHGRLLAHGGGATHKRKNFSKDHDQETDA